MNTNACLWRRQADEDRWGWEFDIPEPRVVGEDLKLLTPYELKILGKSALRLWSYLERHRGFEANYVQVHVPYTKERLGMGYSTVKAALKRLADAGMILRFHDVSFNSGVRKQFARGYHSRLDVWVHGAWDLRAGKLRVLVPREPFNAWVKERRSQGRPRAYSSKTLAHPTNTYISTLTSNQELDRLVSQNPSPNKNNKKRYIPTQSPAPAGAEVLTMNETDFLTSIDPTSPSTFEPVSGQRSWPKSQDLELSKPQSTILTPVSLNESVPNPTKARILATCYRQALKTVYGLDSKVLAFGDITKSKLYTRLVDAADELIEHDIQPEAWAIWMVENAKNRGQAKPPMIAIVFTAGLIKKHRGWFRNTSGHSKGRRENYTPAHFEQLYRLQEAQRRRNGRPWYLGVRQDYYEKRLAEIAAGHENPMDFFPRI